MDSASEDLVDKEPEFNQQLWLEWLKVLSDWPTAKAKQAEHIRDLVRRGIPSNLRARIWKLLAGAQQVTPETSERYKKMLRQPSICEKLIQRDITRTYPEIDYFKEESGPGQERLFNVIKVYSLHDEEVGYCQGSAFIVGLLLMELDEEESFLMLCKIMQEYRMREIYKPLMAELGLCIYQLECLVQEHLPELQQHFQAQNFYTSMYSSTWFLTLFASSLALPLAYRVMDLFLSEGLDMIFRLSVAILQISREDLMKLDMEGLQKYLQKEMPARIECDPDYLIQCACQIKYDSKKMKKLCKDYTTIKTKEQEEAIEFRRMRTENRLLQDRLKMLEIESKELADKLIKGQVCRAQEAEENFVVKRELSQLRTAGELQKTTIADLERNIAELEKLLVDRAIIQTEEQTMMCRGLQEELIAVKLREAENHSEIEQLNKKITEQELNIKLLRENVPEDPIAELQEELGAVKLREAESSFALKELRTKFKELQALWFDHLQQVHGVSMQGASQPSSLETSSQSQKTDFGLAEDGVHLTNSTSQQQASQPSSLSNPLSKFFNSSVIKRASGPSVNANGYHHLDDAQELQKVRQEMLTLKLHESNTLAEVKMLRSREMELETKLKIQDNKFKRKEEEFERINEELSKSLTEVTEQLKRDQMELSKMEWKMKEEQMMMRLREVEHTRICGELRQRISNLESKIEEMTASSIIASAIPSTSSANDHVEE